MSPHTESVSIAGPAGALQCALDAPASDAAERVRGTAVLCHPHPLHGGTMDNKVVVTLARAFVQMGLAAVRFNYRGVGASAGQWDQGRGEVDDALAVVEWGRARWAGASLWLAGFSFGAAVALRASVRTPTARLVTVAPPAGRLALTDIVAPACPWLLIQGSADELLDAAAVREWAARQRPAPEYVELAGASHFFHGRLHDLRDAVLTHAGAPNSL